MDGEGNNSVCEYLLGAHHPQAGRRHQQLVAGAHSLPLRHPQHSHRLVLSPHGIQSAEVGLGCPQETPGGASPPGKCGHTLEYHFDESDPPRALTGRPHISVVLVVDEEEAAVLDDRVLRTAQLAGVGEVVVFGSAEMAGCGLVDLGGGGRGGEVEERPEDCLP